MGRSVRQQKSGFGENLCEKINEGYLYLDKELVEELGHYDLQGKTIAQFCCNNGRELLSLCKMGAERAVGFDIAENMVSFANEAAEQLRLNCTFVATDILEIAGSYYGMFDYIL